MRAYSVDLRERVVAAVDRGVSRVRVAEDFAISQSSVERYLARRRRTGSLAPSVGRVGPRPLKHDALVGWLPQRLAVAADATLAEHAAAFASSHGVVVSGATVCRAIAALPPPAGDPGAALTPSGRVRAPGRPLKQRP